jgi:hypothetical protein
VPLYGKRIDVGQTYESGYGPAVLLYLCPYAFLSEHGFYCPYKPEDIGLTFSADIIPDIKPVCPMTDIEVHGQKGLCIRMQELKHYNKQYGIIAVPSDNTVKAIGMICDVDVYKDDIISVLVSKNTYKYEPDNYGKSPYEQPLECGIKGRVLSIQDSVLRLDISMTQRSRIINIPLYQIKSIKKEG